MTTIAWDGKTLAGDKQTTDVDMRMRTTKVVRIGNLLVGGSGNAGRIRAMHEWIANGRKPEALPSFQNSDSDSVKLLVVDQGQLFMYDVGHCPIPIENPFYAVGSGRDFAMAAMHLGLSAADAVKVSAAFDVGTSPEVDVITADPPPL